MIDAQSFGMGIGVGMMISAIAMPVIYIGFTKVAPHIDRAIRQFRMAFAKASRRSVEATIGNPLMADPLYRDLCAGKQPRDKTGRFTKMTKRERVHQLLAGGQ